MSGYGPPPDPWAGGPGYPVGPPPPHPDARTALVLGIVGVAGFLFCLVPVVVSPFAWAKGARAVREIDASGGRLSGRGDAQGGMIMGIIGTVILGIGLVVAVLLVLVLVIGLSATTGQSGGGNV